MIAMTTNSSMSVKATLQRRLGKAPPVTLRQTTALTPDVDSENGPGQTMDFDFIVPLFQVHEEQRSL
jgi:hypothetical protein